MSHELKQYLGKLSELELEIKLLKKKYNSKVKQCSKYKRLYDKHKPKPSVKEDHYSKARHQVHLWCSGLRNGTLKSITDEYNVSYETLKNIAYKWRKNKANEL